MAHSGIQQRHPQQNHHCKDCGLYFDSVKSLDVHLHYHKENLLSKWATQVQQHNSGGTGDESNNNSHKTGNNNSKRGHDYGSTVAAAADSSDAGAPPPGRPSSTSSMFSRGSPPASTSFTHPPTPGSYSSAPSPYQMESHRFSPAGGVMPASNFGFVSSAVSNRTPPPQNGSLNQFQGYGPASSSGFMGDIRSSSEDNNPGGFFGENNLGNQNSSFILGSGADFPTIGTNTGTLRSSTPNSVSSPSPSSSVGPVTTTTSYRYHPYHHQNNQYTSSDRNGSAVSSSSIAQSSPSHSPQQCDKCGYVCESSAALMEHLNVAHPPTPSHLSGNQQTFLQHHGLLGTRGGFQQQRQSGPTGMFPGYNNQNVPDGRNQLLTPQQIKTEDDPPAEILDLDSHKVHVYQPPPEEEEAAMRAAAGCNGNPHSVSAMLWGSNTTPSEQQKIFQQQQQLLGASSPDFGRGGISTSTMTSSTPSTDGMIVPQQSAFQHRGYLPHQDQHPNTASINSVPHQPIISSTHVPNMNPISSSLLQGHNPTPIQQKNASMSNTQQGQSGGSGNQSWKSNEARRPKTYNCSACNKWFTSSGHLKRHYNTTLHKNAVKQSGVPDPAALPITTTNTHHHSPRDSNPIGQRTGLNIGESSPAIPSPSPSLGEESSRSDDNSHSASFGRITPQHPHNINMISLPNQLQPSPPNPLAGPSATEIPSGGLLLLSSYSNDNNHPSSVHTSPGMSQHQFMLGSASPPLHQPPQQQLGPHLIHHPIPQQPGIVHQRLPSIPTTNTTMSTTAFPNGLPPHVSTTQMPISTNHHLITTTGSLNGSLTNSGINLDDIQQNHPFLLSNHTHLHNGLNNGHIFTPTTIPNHHPLPSFSQFHQNHIYGNNGNTLTILSGFNTVSQNPVNGYHLVNTSENVGGLSLSPNDDQALLDHHQSYSVSPNNTSNNNSYSIMNLEEDINMTSLDVDDQYSPHSNNNTLQGSTDSNGSLGEDIPNLSPVGTPDCPTSTNVDLDQEIPKHHIKQEEGTNVISSTNISIGKSNNNNNNTIFKSSMISNGGIHKCLDCDKVFNKACYLTQHNKSFHSGHKPYKCNRCGKRFPAECMYQEHLGKHAGEKPYKCEICPKQFNHKTDLRRHMCLHTGEKPYACDICGKGFIRKDHMLKHCETHRKKIPHIPAIKA